MRLRILGPLFVCIFALSLSIHAQSPATMSYKAAATTKFGNHPALPTCVTIAVQDGDPATAHSIIMIKFQPGCTIPWHWHTPNERLIILSGSGKADMKDMPSTSLHPGDVLVMPARGIHQFHALSAVTLFDISDAPFDIHYVDASGKEIPVEAALKPVHKAAPAH
jgi:quercetin dioxygenase-like cupin family protein